ncbi:hypothetical protein OCU04_009763 [Sclerotinia nivalis]|uniref:Uncharacterized protein n=1 Tax=Sclerotinia nivalis TaxID=352851 RepID=A0A9X0DGU8_9HELO|nr:hypothetical protein OCU04_009763 [Sclerotinia nivalis]
MVGYECCIEQQLEEEDILKANLYYAGYFDGFAVAEAKTANTITNVPGWSDSISQVTSISPSQVQNISPAHEPHGLSAVQLDNVNSSAINEHLFDLNPSRATAYLPPLNNYSWLSTSDGATSFPDSQSCLALENDGSHQLFSSYQAVSQNKSNVIEQQQFPITLSQTSNAPPPRSITDKYQVPKTLNRHEFSNEAGALIRIENTFDARTCAPLEATLNRQALQTPSPHVARRLKRPKSSAYPIYISLDYSFNDLLIRTTVIGERDKTSSAWCHLDSIPNLQLTEVQAQ